MLKNIQGKIIKFYVEHHYEEMKPRQLVLDALKSKFKSQPADAIEMVCDAYDALNSVCSDEIARQLLFMYRQEINKLTQLAVDADSEYAALSIAKIKARILSDMGRLFVAPDSLKKVEDNLDVVLDILKGS